MADTSVLDNLFLKYAFNKREPDGIYPAISQHLIDMGKEFLGTATFPKDFYRVSPRFPPYYKYLSASTNAEFSCKLVGEIASPDLGTAVSAVGNHIFEDKDGIVRTIASSLALCSIHPSQPHIQFQPISDKSNVKHILALQKPTYASDSLSALFDNQLATLNEIRLADEEEEGGADQVSTLHFLKLLYSLPTLHELLGAVGQRMD